MLDTFSHNVFKNPLFQVMKSQDCVVKSLSPNSAQLERRLFIKYK